MVAMIWLPSASSGRRSLCQFALGFGLLSAGKQTARRLHLNNIPRNKERPVFILDYNCMAEAKKLLVLAVPPFIMPTSPPLGVCMLKGYIERSLPEWSVRAVDLNLAAFERIFACLARGPYLDPRAFKEGPFGEIALSHAREVFHGADETEFYLRPDRYTVYADLFYRLLFHEIFNYGPLEQAYRSGGPMPPLIEEFAASLVAGNPSAVGISVCYTQQVWMAICLGKAVKRRTGAPVIFGGTFFNHQAERFAREHRDVADFIVQGEGELALGRLLENLPRPESVPGVVFCRGEEVISNPPEFVHDLDVLGHPDFSDLELPLYYTPKPVIPVLTSRGCYWHRCSFCTHYKSAGNTYRKYSIACVIEELRRHAGAGIEYFSLLDEMIAPQRFVQLADGIREAGLKVHYYALAKPVKGFTREVLNKMRESGCEYVLWGLESGSQRMLDLMNKGTKLVDVANVLQSSYTAGIFNHVFVLMGFPTETKEDLFDTFRFLDANKNAIQGVQNCVFNLMDDSPVFDCPEKFSITNISYVGDYRSHGFYSFECASGIRHEEIDAIVGQAAPFLGAFNPYSGAIQNMRDHAVLIYAAMGGKLRALPRRVPELKFEQPQTSTVSAA
jgi:anaerobic magnesium-protoporphyrin IX monomethyl ester cyclase